MTRQMTPAEVRELLFEVARLRFPSGRDEHGQRIHPRERIEGLEDHYTGCAMARQQVEEGALYMQAGVKALEDQWDAIEGWETLATGKTQKDVVAAKRKLKPELYDGIREGKWLVDKLKTQARRLERDEEAASRLYTMMGGGG